MMAPADDGVRLVDLPGDLAGTAPLAAEEVPVVYGLARRAEGHFAAPQDVEWTLRRGELFALQSRPITTLAGEAGDGRAQYLSLRRSFENLERLRRRIEDEDLPQMTAAADRLAAVRLEELDDAGLLAALHARKYAHDRAVDVYVADFVPFAHGVRLFGAAYNDALHPDDPYEFTDLLTATPMLSLRRNAALQRIAACLRDGEEAAAQRAADAFVAEFGEAGDLRGRAEVLALAARLAARAAPARRLRRAPSGDGPARPDAAARARRFVEAHPEAERERAEALLDLARASWRLRDDDNLYLDRLRRLLDEALDEAERRGLPAGRRLAAAGGDAAVAARARSGPRGRGRFGPPGRGRAPRPRPASVPRPGRSSGSRPGRGSRWARPGWSARVRISRPSPTARSSSATRSSRR